MSAITMAALRGILTDGAWIVVASLVLAVVLCLFNVPGKRDE